MRDTPGSRLPVPGSRPPAPLFACLHAPDSDAAALLELAQAFSPRYERQGEGCVVADVSGLGRIMGDAAAIGEAIRHDAEIRGVRVHVAITGTATAARLLALSRPGFTVVPPGGEPAALAAVPIAALATITTAPAATFHRWGLKTLGDLAALPAADLAARLGRSAALWQAAARGEDVQPLVPEAPEERFDGTVDLEWPIEGLEPLSFVLTRLLEPIATRLERRDRAVAVLHVRLDLAPVPDPVSGDLVRAVVVRRLPLPLPLRDVRTLRTLALVDLESVALAAPVDRVTVRVDPTPGKVIQHTLFERARAAPEQIATLLTRLGALVGQDRIGSPATVDSYRPGAFDLKAFAPGPPSRLRRAGEPDVPQSGAVPASVLRRYRRPVAARVALAGGRPVRVASDRPGVAGGAVQQAAGPWRSSGDWWAIRSGGSDGSGGEYDRIEWDVALADGAVYRIFQDHSTGAWWIEGIVD